MAEDVLTGRRVLVVEDEYFIADELDHALRAAGAVVVGPLSSVQAALGLLEREAAPEVAILDVNLGGEMAGPVADALRARNVPFLFTTGYNQALVPDGHGAVPWLEKPVEVEVVLRKIRLLLRTPPPGS